MAGRINVGRPRRIKHIPLSWDVNKARSNHQPKFRPVGDDILRGREKTVGQLMEEMFEQMPPASLWISGELSPQEYLDEALRVAEPFRVQVAEILQQTFNDGSLMQEDRIRADINHQLKRLGSPLRLTDSRGEVTKASTDVYQVGGFKIGKSPKYEWAPIGIEAFDDVSAVSTRYAQTRSAELVTNLMIPEQQKVIQQLIGESFTTQQTFSTGRTVTGLTAQQTSQALVNVLQEVNPTTSVGQNVANFRGVNANGLTRPWEKAVYHRAERMADSLAAKGVTGVKAQMRIQRDAQRYANKLRRSRARMISRTEIKRAQVQGQIASMREALDQGLADPATAGKKWITGATDVCEICSDLGFSRAIAVDQSFEGVGDGPPAHPNCRCDLDFSHRIKEAPRAVGAGDPNFPAGTEQNPIVWQFNSGFQTQPSATRAFTPTGFVPPPTIPPPPTPPPVQPPPVVEPTPVSPSAPTPPVQAPVKPTEIKPVSNADIVWDDAGRKWADLEFEERFFLYEWDIDTQLRAHFDDLATEGSAILGVNKSGATLPPLADDASDGVKAIRKQQEKVVKLADEKNQALVDLKLIKQIDDDLDEHLKLGKKLKEGGEGHTVIGRKVMDVGEIAEQPLPVIHRPNVSVLHDILADPELAGSQIQAATLNLRYKQVAQQWREAKGLDRISSVTLKLDDLHDEVDKLGALIKKEAEVVKLEAGVTPPSESWLSRLAGVEDTAGNNTVAVASANRDNARILMLKRLDNADSKALERINEVLDSDDLLYGSKHLTLQIPTWHKSYVYDIAGTIDQTVTARVINQAFESAAERFLMAETERLFAKAGLSETTMTSTKNAIVSRFRSNRVTPKNRETGRSRPTHRSQHLNEIGDDLTTTWKELAEEALNEGYITQDEVLAMVQPVDASTGTITIPTSTPKKVTGRADSFIDPDFKIDPDSSLGARLQKVVDDEIDEILDDALLHLDEIADSPSSSMWHTSFAGEIEESGKEFAELIDKDKIVGAVTKVVTKKDFGLYMQANANKHLMSDTANVLRTIADDLGVAGLTLDTQLLVRAASDIIDVAANPQEALAQAVMQVLHQVRSFGDETINFQAGWKNFWGDKAVGTKMTADLQNNLDMLNDVISKWIPDDWVIQANARGRLGFYRKGNRAHYHDSGIDTIKAPNAGGKADGLINIGSQGYMDESTMLHEINHRFQKNNDIQLLLEKVAVDKRIAASAPPKQKLSRIYSGPDEVGFEDDFSSHYMGKVYEKDITSGVDVETQFIPAGKMPLEASTMASEGVASVKGVTQSDYDEGLMQWFIGMLAGI